MKYDLELFNSGDYYIRLETQEKYDEVMEYLDKNGYIWSNGYSLKTERYWKFYKERTSVRLGSRKRINYSSFDYYKRGRYTELIASEPKQDLIKLLKVGYKIVFRLKHIEGVEDYVIKDWMINEFQIQIDQNILFVDEIYRPKYNGIKPMEWALVWKREEELFTLRLKGNVRLPYYAKGNSQTKYDYTFRKNSLPVNEEKYKVRFTQEDIEKLPKELVALLEKEKVQ